MSSDAATAIGAPGARRLSQKRTGSDNLGPAARRAKAATALLPPWSRADSTATATATVGPAVPSVKTPSSHGTPLSGPGRQQSVSVTSLDAVVGALRAAKRVVVLAGAGISVNCGVPDFRSPTGLYTLVAELGLAVGEPEDLFDKETFADTPELFYEFAHKIWPSGAITPSPTHRFFQALADRRKLQRIYTQNVDGLERAAGIPAAKIVECHGTVLTSRCVRCRKVTASSSLTADVTARRVPRCSKCKHGVMKPEITFFGEAIAPMVFKKMEVDKTKADLLLVVGTTLAVAGVTRLLQLLPHATPQVLINRHSIAPPRSHQSEGFDVELLGDCDDIFGYLADRIGLNVSVAKDATYVAKDATSADLPFSSGATIAEAVTVPGGTDAGTASGAGYLVTENPFNERSVAICLEQVV